MKKRRGSLVIEAMVIFPILLLIIIASLDLFFIMHNRMVALSDIALIKQNLQEHLAQSTDGWTLSENSDLENGNIDFSIKTQRGFLDHFHFGLNASSLADRAKKEIVSRGAHHLYDLEKMSGRFHFSIASYYRLSYQVQINSPFSGLTSNLFKSYRQLEGDMIIPVDSTIQQMTTLEMFIDRLERVEEIRTLYLTLRGTIKKWLDLI